MELFTAVGVPLVTTYTTSCKFWHVVFLSSLNLKCFLLSPVISPLNHWLLYCVFVNFHTLLSLYLLFFYLFLALLYFGLRRYFVYFQSWEVIETKMLFILKHVFEVLRTMYFMCCWVKCSINVC